MTDQTEVAPKLLALLATAVAPAGAAPVVIRDYFKKNARARYSTIYFEFKSRFFDKSENPAWETTFRQYRLLRISPDGPIVAELGGETKVETLFSSAWALLLRQPNGEPGFLQTNGYANIFYVKDKRGTLCAVRTGWASDGWVVDAIPVADPMAWNGQHLIYCPVSAAEKI